MREINPDPDLPPLPPQEPDAFACCGNDCGEACVWTLYQRAQKRYEADLLAWQTRQLEQGK
ncbi:MAG: hypothetical protein H6R19_2313 [Proteobacteria bacterium]|nr:hypothetical protein [Pseudomonadota bacterium]